MPGVMALNVRQVAAAREAFLAGLPVDPAVRPDVAEAWSRAREQRVDPQLQHVPQLDPGPERGAVDLARLGAPVVATAGELLAGTGHGIILADGHGVVLQMAGDRALFKVAERIRCLPGACWDEDRVGNSAVGTCLRLGRPVEFWFAEHFCAGWQDWTCAAVPVRDPETGLIVGAITVSGFRQSATARAMQMAVRLSRTLQALLDQEAAAGRAVLVEQTQRLAARTGGTGILAVDRGGAVLWSAGRSLPGAVAPGTRLSMGGARATAMDPPGPVEFWLDGETRLRGRAEPVWLRGQWQGHAVLLEPPAGRGRAPAGRPGAGEPGPGPVHRLVALREERRILLAPEQVYAGLYRDGAVWLLTDRGELLSDRANLAELAAAPACRSFFRVDRAHLVNLEQVREVHPMFNRTLLLVLADRRGTQIPVSRRRAADLRKIFRL